MAAWSGFELNTEYYMLCSYQVGPFETELQRKAITLRE